MHQQQHESISMATTNWWRSKQGHTQTHTGTCEKEIQFLCNFSVFPRRLHSGPWCGKAIASAILGIAAWDMATSALSKSINATQCPNKRQFMFCLRHLAHTCAANIPQKQKVIAFQKHWRIDKFNWAQPQQNRVRIQWARTNHQSQWFVWFIFLMPSSVSSSS